jgi:hypothetical protein
MEEGNRLRMAPPPQGPAGSPTRSSSAWACPSADALDAKRRSGNARGRGAEHERGAAACNFAKRRCGRRKGHTLDMLPPPLPPCPAQTRCVHLASTPSGCLLLSSAAFHTAPAGPPGLLPLLPTRAPRIPAVRARSRGLPTLGGTRVAFRGGGLEFRKRPVPRAEAGDHRGGGEEKGEGSPVCRRLARAPQPSTCRRAAARATPRHPPR